MADKIDRKIKVALVAPSPAKIGGQSVQAQRLVKAFAGDDEIEMIFVPNDPPAFAQNVKYLRTVSTSLKFWSLLFREIRRARIVHVFSSGTTSYLISTLPPLFVARLLKRKIVLHYHTGEAETHLQNWKRSAAPTMKKFDEIVVPTRFLAEIFERFELPARTIYNFVEREKFKFRERQPLRPVFLSNRNFERHYQVGDVLRAFSVIQKKVPAARFIIAGYGSEEAKLKKLARELRLENVDFTGRVSPDKMPELYDAADIYLNSSIVDNMPLSIIEAYSCGLPVVTTDAGGIPFILEHEKTGLMVKTGDYEALAREALRLLENQTLAAAVIDAARKYCENFSPEEVQTEWRNLYRELDRRR